MTQIEKYGEVIQQFKVWRFIILVIASVAIGVKFGVMIGFIAMLISIADYFKV